MVLNLVPENLMFPQSQNQSIRVPLFDQWGKWRLKFPRTFVKMLSPPGKSFDPITQHLSRPQTVCRRPTSHLHSSPRALWLTLEVRPKKLGAPNRRCGLQEFAPSSACHTPCFNGFEGKIDTRNHSFYPGVLWMFPPTNSDTWFSTFTYFWFCGNNSAILWVYPKHGWSGYSQQVLPWDTCLACLDLISSALAQQCEIWSNARSHQLTFW